MPLNDLSRFVKLLDDQRELLRISCPVDPLLEIAAVTDRVCKTADGGKALLFEAPTGSRFRVATNLFGSRRRVCLALGIDRIDRLTERLSVLLNYLDGADMTCLDAQLADLPGFSAFAPRQFPNRDPELLVMEPPDLRRFPFPQSWPGDGGVAGCPRYITLGQTYTRHPDSGAQNCGLYGAQLRGPTELAMRWKAGSGAARHLELYHHRGEPMPVAITLGGPPAATFSAMLPLPGALDESIFAGFLRSAPLKMISCHTVPLRVPAGCELLIEGYVHPGETVREGPFGNHTGSYAPAADASLLRVTTISHRRNAVIPATVVGPPPMEDCWMAQVWERLLLAFLKKLAPQVRELSFPAEWIFHQSAIISLEKPNNAMVRETAARLWGSPWFSSSRLLIFIDARFDPSDMRAVAWSAINTCLFSRDFFYDDSGKRLALDATDVGEMRVEADAGICRLVEQRWKEYGLP